MASSSSRRHVVLLPYPAQGHITPMLHLSKVLHSNGFYITFVNTDYNHRRMLRSRGSDSLAGTESFRFESIPDGLLPSPTSEIPQDDDVDNVTQDIPELCLSTRENCGAPLRELIARVGSSPGVPPVSCVVADGFMTFALEIARELGLVDLVFSTLSTCGFMGYLHFFELVKRGYVPLKDESCLTNGYLETPIDWIPGMKGIRLKDIPTFIRTTDPDDTMLNFDGGEAQNALKASGVIINTFDDLEHEVVEEMRKMFPRLYTIGPLPKFVDRIADDCPSKSIGSNLWKEDTRCLEWLDGREDASVVYVNFGSITVMTARQLEEFAWGLANSKHPFLWVVRPDLVAAGGESTVVPEGFVEETGGRGVVVGWCPQERVLCHPCVGAFLTHSGWNSTLESICGGVPMMCWPFFAEQPTNCRYVCEEWGIGTEIDGDVRRDDVERMVREMMGGEKGREMRARAREWKERAEAAARPGGSSYEQMNALLHDLQTGNFQVGVDNKS
ncbi:7-deoxyloganetin glucosyltransferase-like [Iris pallida]|uniref:Glycosyltransferase n=1 Tax=Iris pallida TaxID=29817 RepID=A0AAX6F5T9_IRIPA|nr:7-deoxyloganetin glucosyltransferase-like [Iris pallida]